MNPESNATKADAHGEPSYTDESGDFDIFISHAGEDRAVAVRLRQALIEMGLRPWTSFVDIPVGAQYPERIVRAIGKCQAMVLLVSRWSMQSEHVYREVVEASSAARKKPLLPIYIEPEVTIPAGLRYYLQTLHRMKFTAQNIELAAPMLAAALRDEENWRRQAIAPTLAERLTASPLRTWGSGLAITLTAGVIVWGMQIAWGLYTERKEVERRDALPDSLALLQALSAERPSLDASALWQVRLNVMLASDATHFADLKLLAHTRDTPDSGSSYDLTAAIAPAQFGGGQMLTASVPRIGQQITFCLSLPHPRTGETWRLSTPYLSERLNEGTLEKVSFRQSGQAVTAREDGTPCH